VIGIQYRIYIHSPSSAVVCQLVAGVFSVTTHRLVSLKEHNTPTFITCGKIVSSMIKLDGGDDVG
jgi:hypothetical protein